MSNSTTQQSAGENPSQEGDSNIVASEDDSEPWTDRVLDFSEQPLQESEQTIGRLALSMLVVGLGIGLTSLFTWYWIEAAVLPDLGGVEAEIVGGYTPFVFLVIAAMTAPIIASVIGLRESSRISTREDLGIVAIGCLTGAVLLVFVAGVFIGQTGAGGDSPVGPLDLIALAGLSAIVSALLAGLLSMYLGD